MTKNTLSLAAIALLGIFTTSAQAQSFELDHLSLRVGATQIRPDLSSGDLSAPSFPDTQISSKSATSLAGGINYAFTEHWAIDLPMGLPFKHEIDGAGAIAGTGKLGTIKAVPATLLIQYRLMTADQQWQPYIGVGGTYARFYDGKGTAALSGITGGTPSNPTSLSQDNASSIATQIGMSVAVTKHWFLDFNAIYAPLKTTGHLTTGQSIPLTLNSTAASLSVGYHF